MTAITVANTSYSVDNEHLDQIAGTAQDVLTNATITSTASSSYYYVAGARQIDLLIVVVGTVSGTNPTLKFDVAVPLINTVVPLVPTKVADVQTYNGATMTTGLVTTDTITIVNNLIGDYVRVDWTIGGTNTPTFNNVYARIVLKK